MRRLLSICLVSIIIAIGHAAAAPFIVEEGQARAQIVIAKEPARSVRVAAQELQDYVEKISGAKLAIVNEPRAEWPVKIAVGRSALTEKLGIDALDLKAGAYRMVAGEDWLVLIGEDTDFQPAEPWARSAKESLSGELQQKWERASGGTMGHPNMHSYKDRLRLPGETGRAIEEAAGGGKAEPLELWAFDERGSFNAVNGFLQSLGLRWFLPGDLGEVVPKMRSIPLPKVDTVVRPDFPVRQVNFRFAVAGTEVARWAMRLGLRDEAGLQTAHGMNAMTHREELFKAKPEWFALYGGQRQTQPGQRLNQLCYSNEDLLRETVRNVRAQLDLYPKAVPSVMPPDGYGAICQCPLCAGKDAPERGKMGHLSDYVWGFVNRVAKEVGQSHPGRMISNDAYGAYSLPPEKLEKLEPNVQVIIVGGRRPLYDKPEQMAEVRQLREGWLRKTANPLIIFENYPLTARGWYLPAFIPHALGAGINATKGISKGEDIWVSSVNFQKENVAFNSFLVYFTARMYWGGRGQDVDGLFREYCRLFFGPAEKEMRAFFEYCERNWQEIENDKAKADKALALFAAAQPKAATDSVEARRIALVDDYLNGLRNKSRQLGEKRGPVPALRIVSETRGLVLDGKLDEAYWQECPGSATGRLRELQTGLAPAFGTSVKAGWQNGSLYLAIRCEEARGEKPNITSDKKEDGAMWYGDVVEILLGTDSHSYYQIAINPAGVVADLDRGAPKNAWFAWDSQAEVKTQIADGYWTAEVRIPVTEDDSDPLHQVIGHKPTGSLPWHINIGRQRMRDHGVELSAFSPTGTDNFHRELKFAHFYLGRTHQFEAAEPAAEFLTSFQAAQELESRGKHEEALAAFTSAAEGKSTELQKSAALEQAAASARDARKPEQAAEVAARIPIAAVRKTAEMENLLALRRAAQVVEQFGAEEIQAWPFWKTGDGYSARGRAHFEVGDGKRAEEDLRKAVELTADELTRARLWLVTGQNRERNLKDVDGALVAYGEVLRSKKGTGTATFFQCVQRSAELLNRQGKHAEAEAALRQVKLEELRGSWRGTLWLALAETQKAAGRKAEALATYRAIAADEGVQASQRSAAQAAVGALEK